MCMSHIDSFIVGNSGLFDCVVGSYDKIAVYVYACFIFVEPCSFDNFYTEKVSDLQKQMKIKIENRAKKPQRPRIQESCGIPKQERGVSGRPWQAGGRRAAVSIRTG